jgi:uncharacterized protein (DUF305 family)
VTDHGASRATDAGRATTLDGAPAEGPDQRVPAPEPAQVPPHEADDDIEEAEDEAGGHGGLTWGKVAILGLALAFLGFAVGVFATRDDPPGAGSVDVGFLQDMSTHHDQGIGVARLAAAYGEDPTVRSYAREIIAAQSYELGLMSQMLADWGYSRDQRPDEAMGWMGMPVPVDQMPGLLTEEQLAQVDAARGAELDALFLDLMAEHHRGGLHMASEAARNADDEAIRELASRMEHAQAGEINEYRYTAQQLGLDIEIPGADVPPAGLPDQSG